MNSFHFSLLAFLFFLFSCQVPSSNTQSTSQDYDPDAPAVGTVEHITPEQDQSSLPPVPPQPDSLQGKALVFYLEHAELAEDAEAFFKGEWRAGKDDRTISLLKLMVDAPAELRPFYFYLMDRIVQESNGGLSDDLGMRLMTHLQDHPQIFAQHFEGQSMNSQALISHASLVGYELVLQQYPLEAYESLMEQSMTNCASCPEAQQELLTKFFAKVLEVIRLQSEDLESSSE